MRSTPSFRPALALLLAGLGLSTLISARAQLTTAPENPVYIADSPVAEEALLRASELVRARNPDQAVRQLQKLLDQSPNTLASLPAAPGVDPQLFQPLRTRIHRLLLGEPELLSRYRALLGPPAEDLLAKGKLEEVERSYLLTSAGYQACVRLAHEQIDAARFDSALRTLIQLDDHPDRQGPAGAADALARLAKYLPTPRVQALLSRWVPEGALPAAISPPRVNTQAFDAFMAAPSELAETSPIVPKPLWQALYSDPVPVGDERPNIRGVSPEPVPAGARLLRNFPAVDDSNVYLASGRFVLAYDRRTLRERWKADPLRLTGEEVDRPEVRRVVGYQSSVDDLSIIAVAPGLVLAAVGNDVQGEAPETLVALDAATGSVRWARKVETLDPQLVRAHVRGPILIDGSTIVLSLRKFQGERRLNAAYLTGVDLFTGEPRWTAMVGSAGSLPYFRPAVIADASVLYRSAVYRIDRLGVIGAYESSTGRPLWVRRLVPESPTDNPSEASPWEMNIPVPADDAIFCVSPDRSSILKLDPESGRVLAQMNVPAGASEKWGTGGYLLATRTHLVLVTTQRLVSIPLAGFGPQTQATVSERIADPGIRGRVSVAGNRLIVPTALGVSIYDPTAIASKPRAIELDEPGNALVLSDEILICDDAKLHAYLSWETADRTLTRMIESAPSDPLAPVTLADFAARSSRPERLIFAIDAAQRALGPSDTNETSAALRQRLVRTLLSAIDAQQRPIAGKPTLAIAPGNLGSLIERLGQLAATPGDRAAHLLMLGQYHEAASRLPEAISAYQQLLVDATLASTAWDPRGVGPLAGSEATARIEQIVKKHGPSTYAQFEQAAATKAAQLAPSATAAEIESLARSYPLAPVTPSLWNRAAGVYRAQNLPRAEARALELGLQSASRVPTPAPGVVGDLAGSLIENLRGRALLSAAADTLRQIDAKYPGLALSRAGAPLDRAVLSGDLARLLAEQRRWPKAGLPSLDSGKPQVLIGWAMMEPEVVGPRATTVPFIVAQHEDGRIAIFSSKDAAEPLAPIWTSKADTRASLLRTDRSGALLFVMTEASGYLQRVDATTGQVIYKSETFLSFFGGQPAPGTRSGTAYFPTPVDGFKPYNELLVCTDDRSMVLVERSGRAVSVDADTGQSLWAGSLPVQRVFDCDVVAGSLLIAGERDLRRPGGAIEGSQAVILVVDARTGQVVRELNPGAGPVRKLRLSERGDLVALLSSSVTCFDVDSGQTLWRIAQAPASGALEAWIVGDRLLLYCEDRSVWQAGMSDGQLAPGPLDTRARFDGSTGWRPMLTSAGSTAFTTSQGAVIFDPRGQLAGVDALHPADNLLPASMTDTSIMVLSTTPLNAGNAREGDPYTLYQINAETGMLQGSIPLLLGAPPQRLSVLDGRVVVTAGHTTVIYPSAK